MKAALRRVGVEGEKGPQPLRSNARTESFSDMVPIPELGLYSQNEWSRALGQGSDRSSQGPFPTGSRPSAPMS